jgi:transposase-like protein
MQRSKRDLSARRYVCFWADGVCFTPRMDEDRQSMLVSIGADEWGNKDVPGLIDGFRQSTQSWRELLVDLKCRGLEAAPKLAVGDGAMGFRAALHEVHGKTCVQRCWVHKTANGLNAMPKSVQPKARAHLKDIWMADTKAGADAAFDFFVEAYGVKYDRAVKCLTKDRADLRAFHDVPAEHCKHIRTTNPIESTFATVRHRTTKTKGCLSRQTALAMTHQLTLSAKKKGRKLDGQNRLPEIIQGVEFRDGIKHEIKAA